MNRRSVSDCLGITLGAACCSFLLGPCLFCALPKETNSPDQGSILATTIASSIKAISDEKSSAVVRIRCNDGQGEITGTGFYIDPTGTICTLAEIVQGVRDITVEQGGKILPATVVAFDSRSGIAFLKTEESAGANAFLAPVSISNAPALTPVIDIGYPAEEQVTPVLGMITGSKDHDGKCYFCVTHMMASIPLGEGEGGSPVFDLSGNLLGIVLSGNPRLGSCTILPSAAIDQLHHNLLRYGNLNPGWVGAVVEFASVPQHDSRTRIASVDPGSPAESAGLQPGDMLLALGDHPIHTPEDVLQASFYLTAGEPLQLTILRGGTTKTLALTCRERPSSDDERTTNETSEPTAALGAMER